MSDFPYAALRVSAETCCSEDLLFDCDAGPADNAGINPRNTQSFNRYTYVNNNPLSYTDPTGFRKEPVACPACGSVPALPGIDPSGSPDGDLNSGYDQPGGSTSSGDPNNAFNPGYFTGVKPVVSSSLQTLADTGDFTLGAYGFALQSTPGPMLQYFESADPMDLANIVNPDVSYQSQVEHPNIAMLPLLEMQGAAAFATIWSFILEGAELSPIDVVAAIAQGHADSGLAGLSAYMTDVQLQLVLNGSRAAPMYTGTAVHLATAEALSLWYPGRFIYSATDAVDFVFTPTGETIELTTYGGFASHLGRPAFVVCYSICN